MIEFYLKFKSDVVQSDNRVFKLNKGNYKGMRSRLALVISVDRHWLAFNEVRHMYIPLSNRDSCPTMDCRQNKMKVALNPRNLQKMSKILTITRKKE